MIQVNIRVNLGPNVSVRDRFSRNVTVFLWHKKPGGSFEQVGNWTCETCGSWTEANFTYDYNGTDVGIGWRYKFNATNPDGGDETSETEYTIEEDDITSDYIYPAYNGTVNRSQLTNFTINVFDLELSCKVFHYIHHTI